MNNFELVQSNTFRSYNNLDNETNNEIININELNIFP
jgi:hypothetical protein